MSDTAQVEQPGDGWTLDGVAYCQVAIARDDLIDVCSLIRRGNRNEAIDMITATIRQLEAARRHLA